MLFWHRVRYKYCYYGAECEKEQTLMFYIGVYRIYDVQLCIIKKKMEERISNMFV